MARQWVPRRVFFTRGEGRHPERTTSYAIALFDAGLAAQTLLRIASGSHSEAFAIFPPNAELISRRDGLASLVPGEVLTVLLAEHATHEPNRLLTASIGFAALAERNRHGCLAAQIAFGRTEVEAGMAAEELAAEMLATTLGIDFDLESIWDEKKELYRLNGPDGPTIVRTANVTQPALGDPRGWWTTTIAAAILLPD